MSDRNTIETFETEDSSSLYVQDSTSTIAYQLFTVRYT